MRSGARRSGGHLVPDPLSRVEEAASALQRLPVNPIEGRVIARLTDELKSCVDFTSGVREAFMTLVTLTVRFLINRSDRTNGLQRTRYLFTRPVGRKAPLERELANDYMEWLGASHLGPLVHPEVSEIGGGRVDVLVSVGGIRFVVEAKRELDDASPVSLRRFLGQTVAYQNTNVRLGILLVLDLTEKPFPVPHVTTNCWVDRVMILGDFTPRHVVVVRVPGNRRHPSATETPTGSDL